MKFIETRLKGAFIIEPEIINDERGFFARTFCKKEFEDKGLDPNLSQISIAYNKNKYTIRGMHYMLPPNEEAKLVRCSRGSVYDVVLDLRKDSKTFKEWISLELTEKNNKMVYLPKGCVHGYETLTENTEVIYHMSRIFDAKYYCGVRYNDLAFNIKWPEAKNIIISGKDKNYPNFNAPQS